MSSLADMYSFDTPIPATEKQVKYVKQIAKELKIRVNPEMLKDGKKTNLWIDEMTTKLTPTVKQINMIKRYVIDNEINPESLPETLTTRTGAASYISAIIEATK
jgi:hypothetical protein